MKRTCCCWRDLSRSWYKNLPWASRKSFQISTANRWHLQDLHARTLQRTSPGSPQDLLRTWAGSCKELWENFTTISAGSSQKDLYKITQGTLPGFQFSQHLLTRTSQDLGHLHVLRSSETVPRRVCKVVMDGFSQRQKSKKPLARLKKISYSQHRATTRATRHIEYHERVVWCVSYDLHRAAPRGAEWFALAISNSHYATTRVIRHAQSHGRVARTHTCWMVPKSNSPAVKQCFT